MIENEMTNPSPTALRFEAMVNASKLTQKEMAKYLGYEKPNVITMFKQGLTKIPVDKIPRIAKLFNVDAAELLKLAMKEYEPKKYEAIIEIMGEPITDYERRILETIKREVRPEALRLDTQRYCDIVRNALRDAV
jgi:transcriptional regulator with XRE-family HTH domain